MLYVWAGRDRSVTGGGSGEVSRGQFLEGLGHGLEGGWGWEDTRFKVEGWQRLIYALEGPSGSLVVCGGEGLVAEDQGWLLHTRDDKGRLNPGRQR